MNGVPWSLLKKVPQAPKCLEHPSTQVPQVPQCIACSSYLTVLSASSGLTALVSWVPERPSACRMPTEWPDGAKFGSLFVRIKTFVGSAGLTKWFSCQNFWMKIVHKWMILIYWNNRKQCPKSGVYSGAYSRK